LRPYLKKTHHKNRARGVAQRVGPEFKSQYCKKQNKTKYSSLRVNANNNVRGERRNSLITITEMINLNKKCQWTLRLVNESGMRKRVLQNLPMKMY
jgi:hypothetical protein